MVGKRPESKEERGYPSSPPPALERKKVGRYDVIYPIAQGGMGGVHAGRLSGMAGFEKLVALKVVHSHLASETSFIRMFLDEARLAAQIHHPNVAEIYEVGEDRGMFFMAGELIIGQSLNKLYRGARRVGRRLSDAVYAEIAAKVCMGLHKAHELTDEQGKPLHLVHRDVTPKNILISYDGFVKLIDFGVAFAKDRLSHTEVGTLKGKAGFMAPEQIKGEELDRRIDIFSLGIVLYMCTLGSHPFPGNSDVERMHKIVGGEYPLPHTVRADYPPELEAIIVKALAQKPDDRYRDTASMGAELEHWVRSTGQPSGTAALAEIMRSLFADEQEFHRSRIREYRLENADDAVDIEEQVKRSIMPTPAATRSSSGGATIVYGEDGQPIDGDSRVARHAPSSALLAIGVAVLIVGAFAVFWYFAGGRELVLGPAAPMASREPVATVPSPATPTAVAPSAEAVKPPEGSPIALRLAIEPAGASLEIDGQRRIAQDGVVMLPRDSESHRVVVSAPGYRTRELSITADEDQVISVELRAQARKRSRRARKSRKDPAKKEAGGTSTKGGSSLRRNPYQ